MMKKDIIWTSPLSMINYKFYWCNCCGYYSISCPNEGCHATSCNGSWCNECSADFDYFLNNAKLQLHDYLTDEELEVLEKADYLKRWIELSASRGYNNLNEDTISPYSSNHSRSLFPNIFTKD